ncbi:hypothetical protein ACFQS3_07600 [Glycomyces mayteni]|uniref:Uncharacterized protein n=1 Tax=Glycomyces mayteni TaxID=543887 RepID=A0ABW2D7R9_9ACTN
MHGEKLGAVIGFIGGLVFVLVNAGGLPGPLPLVARIVGVAAFLAAMWVVMRRKLPAAVPPARESLRTYWIAVAAEVVAIIAGANVINRVFEQPDLTVCWVVLVVGVHFLPFAKAFDAPVFTPLAWTLVALGLAGGALTLATTATAAAATAVLAGFVLLGFSSLGSLRKAPEPA